MMSSMTESLAGAFGGGGNVDEEGGGGGVGGGGFDYRSLLPNRSADSGDSGISSDASLSNEEDECCGLCAYLPSMTWRERLLGCVTCMIAGYLLSFGSFFRIKDLILGDPFPFVFNATGKQPQYTGETPQSYRVRQGI